jgi:hypothetical protein
MIRDCLHIIHLPERTDRWELLQHELEAQQVTDYRIWAGIRDYECPQRGISKAHKQIIAWAKSGGLPAVLIAEDDIAFSGPGALDYFLNEQPSDFDLYLGGIVWGDIQSDHTVDDFAGTTLYLACQRFYPTLLDLPEDKDYDRALAGRGKFVVCSPLVASQHSGFSDHHNRLVSFKPAETLPYRSK